MARAQLVYRTMQEQKVRMRQEMRGKVAAMEDSWRINASRAVVERVVRSAFWREARVIGLFSGRPDEVHTDLFWMEESARKKRFCYPKVQQEHLIFLEVTNPGLLQKGAWGVLEPSGEGMLVPDLLIVPGLAFDSHGRRLGRGKGFYDRYLTNHPETSALGVCFDFQVRKGIPTEAHDALMNGVATEKMIYTTTR